MSKPASRLHRAAARRALAARAVSAQRLGADGARAARAARNAGRKVFYRGYDVLDRENVGFVSQRCESAPAASDGAVTWTAGLAACRTTGWRYDTAERGNGNGGHVYGTDLATEDKARWSST